MSTRERKILITGGAGFIGLHLAKRLAEQGNTVVLADNLPRESADADLEMLLKNPQLSVVVCDLAEPASMALLGSGYDYVYHLAGLNGFRKFMEIPHEVLRVGIRATLHILEWFGTKNNKPAAKMLFTSSNEVFMGGDSAFGVLPIPTPEHVPLVIPDPYHPRWSYAATKLLGELLFIHYAKAYNLRMGIVRLHNLYGPRAGYDAMIPKFFQRIQKRADPFPLFGPDDTRASCYITDAVEAMQTVMETSVTDGQTYHIGDHREETIRDIVEMMCEIAQWHPKEFDIKPTPRGGTARDILDISKIKRDTGWEAKTALSDGLRKTIEWYLANPQSAESTS